MMPGMTVRTSSYLSQSDVRPALLTLGKHYVLALPMTCEGMDYFND